MKSDFRNSKIPFGTRCFFEYHCKESHDSSDAELWYRSHQKVEVMNCVNDEFFSEGSAMRYRIENGTPLAYEVAFSDGFRATAMEDELLEAEVDYGRPDPPQRPASVVRGETNAEQANF